MAVAARGEGAERVVEVDGGEEVEAEEVVELGQEVVVAGRLVERVAGGEGVAGVEADRHPFGARQAAADGRQLLEPVAEAGALAGGVLQQHASAAGGDVGEHPVELGGEARHPALLAGAGVGAGVEHQAVDPQRLTAVQLVGQRGARAGRHRAVGRRQVDQVAGVGEDRADGARRAGGAKRRDLLVVERFRPPLVGVLDEDLDRPAAEILTPRDGLGHPAGDRDVGAERRESGSAGHGGRV